MPGPFPGVVIEIVHLEDIKKENRNIKLKYWQAKLSYNECYQYSSLIFRFFLTPTIDMVPPQSFLLITSRVLIIF